MSITTLPKKIEHLDVDKLIPYARNARQHSPEQIEKIASSIREFGFTSPVLIRDDNTILAGHGRVMAAQRLGMAAVPCIRLAHLSEAQARAYVLADNRMAEMSEWDAALLESELDDLSAMKFDLDVLAFDEIDVDEESESAPKKNRRERRQRSRNGPCAGSILDFHQWTAVGASRGTGSAKDRDA